MRIYVGIAATLIAAACGGSSPTSYGSTPPPPPPPPPGPAPQSITMTDYTYSLPSLSVKVGTVVKWSNNGSVPHTATSDAGTFDSGALGPPTTTTDPLYGTTTTPGGTYSMTFSAPGTSAYHCIYHGVPGSVPGTMKGTITVTQ